MSIFNQYQPRQQYRPSIPNLQKRQVLWNIIQPGDNYDIKRSMIAKIPGDNKDFMGEHLEIVCLLQAAQIQRLCQYLEQHKLKLRETQRCQLDRHSYEIQIKELTEQLSQRSTQITKLRDYINKLSNQLQNLRKTLSTFDSNLKPKYEQCLLQIKSLRNQRQRMQLDLQKSMARISSSQNAHQIQIQQSRKKLHGASVFDTKMKDTQIRYQNQINELELRLQKLQESHQRKNIQNQNLQRNLHTLSMNFQQEMIKNKKVNEYNKLMKQYQNRFSLVGKQIERLNLVLRNQSNQYMNSQAKCNQLEAQLRRKQTKLHQFYTKIHSLQIIINQKNHIIMDFGNNHRAIQSYEIKFQQMSIQIARLNYVLKNKNDENSQLIKSIKGFQLQFTKIQVMKKHYEELRVAYTQFQGMRPKIADNQNRLALQGSQIQRLNLKLNELQNRNRTLQSECQKYYNTLHEFQKTVPKNWNQRINIAQQKNIKLNLYIKELEEGSNKLSYQLLQYENKVTLLSHEIQRLNHILKENIQALDAANARTRNLEISVDQQRRFYQENEKNIVYELTLVVNKLKQQLQASKNGNDSKLRNDIAKYQNQIGLLSQEIDRYNHILKMKVEEVYSLEEQLKNYRNQSTTNIKKIEEREMEIAKQWKMRVTKLEEHVVSLSHENEGLREQYKGLQALQALQTLQGYQNKIIQLSQEIDRLNDILDKKIKQNSIVNQRLTESEQTVNRLTREVEQNRRRLIDLKDLELKISQYQNKIAILGQQIQRLNMIADSSSKNNRGVNQDLENAKRRISELQGQVSQFRIKISSYEQTITVIQREKQEMTMKAQGSQSQALHKLNNEMIVKNDQLRKKQDELRSLSVNLQSCKKHCQQLQGLIKNNWQVRVYKFEQEVAYLNRQKDELISKLNQPHPQLFEYQNKIKLLYEQITRLNQILKAIAYEKSLEIENHHHEKKQLEASIQEWKSKKTLYQRQIYQLSIQNQKLNRRSSQLSQHIAQLQNYITNLQADIQKYDETIRKKQLQLDECIGINKNLQNQIASMINKMNESDRSISQDVSNKIQYEDQINKLNRTIEHLNRQNIDALSRSTQYQSRILMIDQEINQTNREKQDKINNLNEIINKKQLQLQQLRRFYQENEKNIVYEWTLVVNKLKQQLQASKNGNDSKLRNDIAMYQNQIGLLSQEIDRHNHILKMKVEEVYSLEEQLKKYQSQSTTNIKKIEEREMEIAKQWKMRVTKLEEHVVSLSHENEGLREQYKGLQTLQTLQGYQNKIIQLSQEIDRLNDILDKKIKQNSIVNQRLTESEQTVNRLTREVEQNRRRLIESKDLQLKISQYQNKIAILGQQIQRLNMIADSSSKNNRGVNQDLENAKRRISELQGQVSQFRIKISSYEQTITVIQREKQEMTMKAQGSQSQALHKLNSEMIVKNDQLRRKQDELRSLSINLQSWKKHCQQLQESIKNDWQVRVYKFEQEVAYLNRQKDQILSKYNQNVPKIDNYEDKIGLLSHQIERLNLALRQKLQESRKVRYQNDHLHEITRSISGISKQCENYRSEIKIYQSKCTQLGNQIQRLNTVLKSKLEENALFQRECKKLGNQIENLQKSKNEYENYTITQLRNTITKIQHDTSIYSQKLQFKDKQLNDVNRRISQYQNKIALLIQQIQRLGYNLKNKIDENDRMQHIYRQQIQKYNEKMDERITKQTTLFQEIQRLNGILKQIKDQNQGKSLKESQYLSDIDRLNITLRLKVEESARWQESYKKSQIELNSKKQQYNKTYASYKKVISQYQSSKIHIQQYENSIKRLYAEFQRLQNVMKLMKDQNINLKRSLQNSQGLFERNRRLAAQIDRLNIVRKDLIHQNEQVNLRLANQLSLQKRINQYLTLIVVLFAQIQSLRQRVKDKQKQIEEVRRSSLLPLRLWND